MQLETVSSYGNRIEKKTGNCSSSGGDGINDEWNNSNNETKWDNIWIEKSTEQQQCTEKPSSEWNGQ